MVTVVASLDISIVMFALVVSMLLLILALATRQKLFFLLSGIYGIFIVGYFIANYSNVAVGTFTIPLNLFLIAWFFLCIMTPFVLLIQRIMR